MTDATSSLLGAGLEMILISSERLKGARDGGAAILGMDDGNCHRRGKPATRNASAPLRRSPFPLLQPGLAKKSPTPMADKERHPFLAGAEQAQGRAADGGRHLRASGDLTARKLIPAIYNLGYDNLLPADFHLVGYGRKPIPDDEFPLGRAAAVKEFSAARARRRGLEARRRQHDLRLRRVRREGGLRPAGGAHQGHREGRWKRGAVPLLHLHPPVGVLPDHPEPGRERPSAECTSARRTTRR